MMVSSLRLSSSVLLVVVLLGVLVVEWCPVLARIHQAARENADAEAEDMEYDERYLTDSSGDDNIGQNPGQGVCFSAVTTVQERDLGLLSMKDLRVGHQILTKSGTYQTVYTFAHRQPNVMTTFLQIHYSTQNTTSTNTNTNKKQLQPLEVTGQHLVYLQNKNHPVRADTIHVGDRLWMIVSGGGSSSIGGGGGVSGEVVKIQTIQREGLYAPWTQDGTLVVDGVAASNYVSFQKDYDNDTNGEISIVGLSNHLYAHMVLSPFRLLCFGITNKPCQSSWDNHDNDNNNNKEEEEETAGMPHVIAHAKTLDDWVQEQNELVQFIILWIILILTGVCWITEALVGPTAAPWLLVSLGGVVAMFVRGRFVIQKVKIV